MQGRAEAARVAAERRPGPHLPLRPLDGRRARAADVRRNARARNDRLRHARALVVRVPARECAPPVRAHGPLARADHRARPGRGAHERDDPRRQEDARRRVGALARAARADAGHHVRRDAYVDASHAVLPRAAGPQHRRGVGEVDGRGPRDLRRVRLGDDQARPRSNRRDRQLAQRGRGHLARHAEGRPRVRHPREPPEQLRRDGAGKVGRGHAQANARVDRRARVGNARLVAGTRAHAGRDRRGRPGDSRQARERIGPARVDQTRDRGVSRQAGRHLLRQPRARLLRERRRQDLPHHRRRRQLAEGLRADGHLRPLPRLRRREARRDGQHRPGLLPRRHRHDARLPHRGRRHDLDARHRDRRRARRRPLRVRHRAGPVRELWQPRPQAAHHRRRPRRRADRVHLVRRPRQELEAGEDPRDRRDGVRCEVPRRKARFHRLGDARRCLAVERPDPRHRRRRRHLARGLPLGAAV